VGEAPRVGEIDRIAVTIGSAGRSPGKVCTRCTTGAAQLRTRHAQPASLIWAIAAGNGAGTTNNSGARRLSAASSFSERSLRGPNSARRTENTGDHDDKRDIASSRFSSSASAALALLRRKS
jgi:hypothetical protein